MIMISLMMTPVQMSSQGKEREEGRVKEEEVEKGLVEGKEGAVGKLTLDLMPSLILLIKPKTTQKQTLVMSQSSLKVSQVLRTTTSNQLLPSPPPLQCAIGSWPSGGLVAPAT